MRSRSFYDSLIFACLLMAIVSFPYEQFIQDSTILYIVEIWVRLILVAYAFMVTTKNGFLSRYNHKPKICYLLFFVPFLLACFSNIIFVAFAGIFVKPIITLSTLFEIILALLTAIYEEMLFRLYFHNLLKARNPLLKILASAGIFALFHAISFVFTLNINYLIQGLYTFGLGVLLGFIYTYGKNIYACMGYHFLFNLLNDVIYSIICGGIYTDKLYLYYVINSAIAVVLAIYVGLLYAFYLRKVDVYDYWHE